MLIITGTGRSGTATLARLLGGHHEFRVNYILDKYFSLQDPHMDHFRSLRTRVSLIMDLHQGIHDETFIDSSNLYLHFIDAIHLLNPEVKFILTVRDGRDFARSAITRGWHERRSFGTVPLRDDSYFNRWDGMSPVQRAAWIWTWRNKKALAGLKGIPEDRKYILKIEDLESAETIRRLERFSGVTITDASFALVRANANPSFSFPRKEDWSPEQVRQFTDIAGEMMNVFSYG